VSDPDPARGGASESTTERIELTAEMFAAGQDPMRLVAVFLAFFDYPKRMRITTVRVHQLTTDEEPHEFYTNND